ILARRIARGRPRQTRRSVAGLAKAGGDEPGLDVGLARVRDLFVRMDLAGRADSPGEVGPTRPVRIHQCTEPAPVISTAGRNLLPVQRTEDFSLRSKFPGAIGRFPRVGSAPTPPQPSPAGGGGSQKRGGCSCPLPRLRGRAGVGAPAADAPHPPARIPPPLPPLPPPHLLCRR